MFRMSGMQVGHISMQWICFVLSWFHLSASSLPLLLVGILNCQKRACTFVYSPIQNAQPGGGKWYVCLHLVTKDYLKVITAAAFAWHVLWLSENLSCCVSTTAMSWQGCNKIEGSWSCYIYITITCKSTEQILCVSSLLVLCLWHCIRTLEMCPLP